MLFFFTPSSMRDLVPLYSTPSIHPSISDRAAHSCHILTRDMAALVASIAERLSSLSILPGPSDDSTATTLRTYTFKPKGSADVPKLVVVLAEQDKDIGKASALAKKIGNGIKDMRAAEEDYLKQILGDVETKESGALSLILTVLVHSTDTLYSIVKYPPSQSPMETLSPSSSSSLTPSLPRPPLSPSHPSTPPSPPTRT